MPPLFFIFAINLPVSLSGQTVGSALKKTR